MAAMTTSSVAMRIAADTNATTDAHQKESSTMDRAIALLAAARPNRNGRVQLARRQALAQQRRHREHHDVVDQESDSTPTPHRRTRPRRPGPRGSSGRPTAARSGSGSHRRSRRPALPPRQPAPLRRSSRSRSGRPATPAPAPCRLSPTCAIGGQFSDSVASRHESNQRVEHPKAAVSTCSADQGG